MYKENVKKTYFSLEREKNIPIFLENKEKKKDNKKNF